MCLAIEPMVNVGGPEVKVLDDGWTAVTVDGSLSAHFELSVAVTEHGPWILSEPYPYAAARRRMPEAAPDGAARGRRPGAWRRCRTRSSGSSCERSGGSWSPPTWRAARACCGCCPGDEVVVELMAYDLTAAGSSAAIVTERLV